MRKDVGVRKEDIMDMLYNLCNTKSVYRINLLHIIGLLKNVIVLF